MALPAGAFVKMRSGKSISCGSSGRVHRRQTISIIDDDQDVRGSLDSFLRSSGLRVVSFGSAEEFLEFTGEADCIVTDLNMPGMGGVSLLALLASRKSEIPAIAMTAFPSRTAEKDCLALGAAAFLIKPLDPEILLAEILKILPSGPADRLHH